MDNDMNVEPNEILLIYDSKDIEERKLLGYAKSLQHHAIKEFDIQSDSFTELQLKQIADRMGVSVTSLIDQTTVEFQEAFKKADISPEGVIKAISSNPKLIKTPIAMYEKSAEFVSSGYQFVKKDMTDGETVADKMKNGKLREH